MADAITLARPYAKAIFEYSTAKNILALWSDILAILVLSITEKEAIGFITNPVTRTSQHIALLSSPFHMLPLTKENPDQLNAIENLLRLLARNNRLFILPDIKMVFNELRAKQEKTLQVRVLSFSTLSTNQKNLLKEALHLRLGREISLEVVLDKTLLGGVVIQAGDLVIDGSVKEQLNRLNIVLAA